MVYDNNREKTEVREKSLIEAWRDVNARIAGIFTILVLAVLPLVFQDRYRNILVVKYRFYFISVLVMLAAILITAIVFLHKDAVWYDWKYTKQIREGLHIKNLRVVDWAMLAFVAAAAVSAFQSDYFYESFWGNEGRYSGLFLILLYGASFFVLSRCLRFKRLYLDAFLAGGLAACAVGILHFFRIDPLRLKEGLSYGTYKIFLSTIGNVNTYTAYLGMLAAVGAVLFVLEEKKKKKRFYLVSFLVTLFSMVASNSDNAYITLGILFGLLPLYLFGSIKGIKQYMLMVSALFTEILLVGSIYRLIPEHVMEIEGVFEIVSRFAVLPAVTVFLWIGTALLYKRDRKREQENAEPVEGKLLKRIWLAMLILVASAVCLIILDANVLGNAARYSGLGNYVVFNEEWGTHRGYIWKTALTCYRDFPLLHKLFGFGPDTFGIMSTRDYLELWIDGMDKYYETYENAHNEYLQYLITVGCAGLLAYVTLLVSGVAVMLKNMSKRPELLAVAFAVICYAVQAVVNINVVIVVPIMLTLLTVGAGVPADKASPDPSESADQSQS